MASGHVAYPYLFQNKGIEHKSIVSKKQNSCQISTPRVIRGPFFVLFQTPIIWVSILQTNKYVLRLPSGAGASAKWSKGYIWQQLGLKIKSGSLQGGCSQNQGSKIRVRIPFNTPLSGLQTNSRIFFLYIKSLMRLRQKLCLRPTSGLDSGVRSTLKGFIPQAHLLKLTNRSLCSAVPVIPCTDAQMLWRRSSRIFSQRRNPRITNLNVLT